mmetsp:Transcript_41286/g.100187  ORF Transcript_41286/g.100187 Transcript_41286/m.100187 type:complete len:116 (-) Transcript_41286:332-679(-)
MNLWLRLVSTVHGHQALTLHYVSPRSPLCSIRAAAVKQSKAKFCGEGSPAAVSHGSISARPGGMLAKVKAIKDSLGITATVPKDVVAEANAQIGLCSQGPLIQQVDALMEALGLE